MSLIRKIVIPSLFVASFLVLGVWQDQLSNESVAQSGRSVPRFEVDPFWPQPLPNHWVMGNTIGIDIDDQDRIIVTDSRGRLIVYQKDGNYQEPST